MIVYRETQYCHGEKPPTASAPAPMTTATLMNVPEPAPRKIYLQQPQKDQPLERQPTSGIQSSHKPEHYTHQKAILNRQRPISIERSGKKSFKYLMNIQKNASLSSPFIKQTGTSNRDSFVRHEASEETNEDSDTGSDTEDSTDNKLDKPKVSC